MSPDKHTDHEKRITVIETEMRFIRMVGSALIIAVVGLVFAMIAK